MLETGTFVVEYFRDEHQPRLHEVTPPAPRPTPLSLLTSLPGRTPILQTAEKLRLDEWNRAPKEITSQYPESVLAPAKELVEEDPQLVVDCIVDQLTVFMPTTNNYPGKVAKKYKWLLWLLPPIVLNAFEVLEVREIGKGPYPDVVRQMQQN